MYSYTYRDAFIGRIDAEAETPAFWPPDVMLGKTEGGGEADNRG